ncbi:MAG: acetyl-CoA carboxylase biotin carboxyl carrier protein subunit [Crocinitomicaceae bacterium]|nr:acetyl-CoA carboxylase biotin carboxyl carrier protein subunit [Crocinitomicaceae bacterium]
MVNVLGNNVYQIDKEDSSLILEVLKVDLTEKSITVRSNHRTYDLIFKDQLDHVLDKMGIKRTSELVNKNVKAPMPGKVLELLAKEGDTLSKGDNILILEAMKMENVIKAEVDCVIKKIHISSQENVEKNQVLIELDFI